jgi:hypothetical protein
VPGVTNCLILTPADSTTILFSLKATGAEPGFSILLVNASQSVPLQIIPGEISFGFLTPTGSVMFLPPLSSTIAVWISPGIVPPGFGYWMITGPPQNQASSQLVTGSGTGSVTAAFNYDTNVIILDGVSSTFALTFPGGAVTGQVVEVLFNTLVSAFSVVAMGSQTINNVPTSGAAGTGIAWYYNLSNDTWYRQY